MLLVLHRSDLIRRKDQLPLTEVDAFCFRKSAYESIQKANMVMFYDHKTDAIKILKNRWGNNFIQHSEK